MVSTAGFLTPAPNTVMCFGTHLSKCCDTKGAELTILSDEMSVKTTVKGTAEVDDQPGMEEGRVDSPWLGRSSKLDQLTQSHGMSLRVTKLHS